MLPRYGSRLFLGLLVLGGVFILANSFLAGLLAQGSRPDEQSAAWGLGLIFALLVGVPAVLLAFHWLRRPQRQLAAVARQARGLTGFEGQPDESNFVLDTFRSALGQLQAQRSELERLHAQVSVRAASAEKLSEHIVSSVPSGLVAFDPQGRVTLLNHPAQMLLETPPEVNGMNARVLLRHAPNLLRLIEDCLMHGTLHQREEITLRHTDGRRRRLGASVGPLETAEGRGVLCLFTDLTEVTQLREQVALKKNLENLGEMSAGLAHEFKNALAALQSYAQLVENSDVSGTGRVAAGEMLGEVRQLSEMVTSFLNFARPNPLNLAETNLRELLDECAEELAPLYAAKGIALEITGDAPNLQADEIMLRQALLNLLRNAAEAIEAGQAAAAVTVKVAQQKGRGARNPRCLVTIADSGPGIAPEDLERIFIPFFTTKDKGHGVGLALAHRVISQHGGALTAENGVRGGALFRLVLPALPIQPSK
jgi:PAS domain S-box-containing protein